MTTFYDRSWRLLTDVDLARALAMHRRALALVDAENPDPIVRESTREYLAMLVEDGEAEEARRRRCVALGIPRDPERFPPDFLAAVRSAVRLDDLLAYEAGAKLGRANGRGIRRGPCPFCKTSDESTSLVVSVAEPENQWWYCFACCTGGDCFTAIMAAWGLEFPQAVEKLAKGAGLAPPPQAPASRPRLPAKRNARVVLSEAARR